MRLNAMLISCCVRARLAPVVIGRDLILRALFGDAIDCDVVQRMRVP